MKWLAVLIIFFAAFAAFTDDTPAPVDAPSAPSYEASPAYGTSPADKSKNAELTTAKKGIIGSRETIAEQGVINRLGIAAGVVIVQGFLIWGIWIFFRRFTEKMRGYGEKKFKPVVIKKFNLLGTAQIINGCSFLLRILKYTVTVFQLFITVPIIFSLFQVTKDLATTLFHYILTPIKNIALATLNFIPDLITIAIIIFIMRYILRTLNYFAKGLEKGKLKLTGFYPEWARPTYNILRVLVYAFTVAVVYPYLPGSQSAIFKGVSVFVGVIFSLGSSSAISNLVAGLVITYMRPFKIGDRIKLGDVVGFVIEKSPIVIRLRTHKNEYVTFPNVMVLNSITTNYTTSQETDEEGLILHADVTMNYKVPWPQVHEILLAAAKKTSNTEKTPKPFVLQQALDDYYCRYEINVYTKAVSKIPSIYSELYQNLQDGFNEAGIDLTAPAYTNIELEADKK